MNRLTLARGRVGHLQHGGSWPIAEWLLQGTDPWETAIEQRAFRSSQADTGALIARRLKVGCLYISLEAPPADGDEGWALKESGFTADEEAGTWGRFA
ncbi:hypothetical protein ACFQX4_22230 [Roseomonas sp. GCM10028921]